MNARIREVALTLLRELASVDLRDGNAYEEDWCVDIAERLNRTLPVSATASRKKGNYYPGSRQSVDLLVKFPDRPTLWLESQGAWKSCFGDTGKSNPAYRKHLLHEDPKEHSALSDILSKLTQIATPGDFVGELLIGFDSVQSPMDAEIAELIERAGLNRHPWESYHLRWSNPNDSRYSFGCWLRVRPVLPPIGTTESDSAPATS